MSAYVIVAATVKDKEKQQAYAASVPGTLKKYSGELVVEIGRASCRERV